MRLKLILFSFLLVPSIVFADVYPQAGLETYMGSNKLFSFTPWAGLRVKMSDSSSLIFKYYNHNISFENYNTELTGRKRVAHLSNFTAVFYTQKWGHDFYSALSYFTGSDSYKALAMDSGTILNISGRIAVLAGIYLVNEKSILWYPDDAVRNIALSSVNGGVKYKIKEWLSLTSKIYLYKNSEDVTAHTYSLGVTFIPKEPIFLTAYYFRYSESARYRFSGDYVSLGLNFYY